MKAVVHIKNLNCDEGKKMIVRNLSRIMDIRIIDIDIEMGQLLFLYATPLAFHKVRQELARIGYPIQSGRYPMIDASQSLYENDALETATF